MSDLRILALDPASHCGVAHTSGYRTTWSLVAHESEHAGLRLVRLRDYIHDVATTLGVDLIAFEHAALGAGRRQMNNVVFHSRMAGVIYLVAAELGVPFVPINPTELKRFATGSGGAQKDQMIAAAKTQLGIVCQDDNVADAVWVLEFAKHKLQQRSKPKAEECPLWK